MKIIRLRVREKIDELGITRYELAKRAGVIYQVINKYYKDQLVRYDKDILLRICVALDCGIEEIIEIVDQPENDPGSH